MINLIIRTVIIYVAVIFVMRLMGKRQIGQLQPFEIVITLIIADLAAMPMQDEKIPLLRGIVPLFVLLLMQVIFSYILFLNKRFRTWLNGTPTVLIGNGKINHKALKDSLVSLSDVVESMHAMQISDISQIDYAILETSGNISFFPKPEFQAAEKNDINADISDDNFGLPLVMNGKFLPNYMQYSNFTEETVINAVKADKKTLDDVMFCYTNSNGQIKTIYKKEQK